MDALPVTDDPNVPLRVTVALCSVSAANPAGSAVNWSCCPVLPRGVTLSHAALELARQLPGVATGRVVPTSSAAASRLLEGNCDSATPSCATKNRGEAVLAAAAGNVEAKARAGTKLAASANAATTPSANPLYSSTMAFLDKRAYRKARRLCAGPTHLCDSVVTARFQPA